MAAERVKGRREGEQWQNEPLDTIVRLSWEADYRQQSTVAYMASHILYFLPFLFISLNLSYIMGQLAFIHYFYLHLCLVCLFHISILPYSCPYFTVYSICVITYKCNVCISWSAAVWCSWRLNCLTFFISTAVISCFVHHDTDPNSVLPQTNLKQTFCYYLPPHLQSHTTRSTSFKMWVGI